MFNYWVFDFSVNDVAEDKIKPGVWGWCCCCEDVFSDQFALISRSNRLYSLV